MSSRQLLRMVTFAVFFGLSVTLDTRQEEEALSVFGQTIPIAGNMERTDRDFVDGLVLDLFAPTPRTAVVQQNFSPLPATFVIGSTGEPFVAASNYSYIINMSNPARDLIAKIELPYDPEALRKIDIDPANTYVGVLNSARNAWIISESQRNVHVTENKTRIIKMTSLDGEYRLLARATADTSNIFVQYGQGATRTVNITAGPGIQEAEFIDGLRFSVQSAQLLKLNVDLKNGVETSSLPDGMQSLYSFSWSVNTSDPSVAVNATISFPVNLGLTNTTERGTEAAMDLLSSGFVVAKRPLNGTAAKFSALTGRAALSVTPGMDAQSSVGHIKLGGFTQLDGEYVVLKTGRSTQPAAATMSASSAPVASPPGVGNLVTFVALVSGITIGILR
ncbi:hypothetical protein B0J12DRAFT_657518 [Macrophomina phaseolina]|uniref:Six-bladed beta-propeller TolB-like protein n=1 Tax=Macrophomina phaseolina TaxID=35725 RepID=A0ABQ8GFG9_9PEZI|nr:hypothetical protein B0J12DRAFT_657518 [Macrophomina phaseolina]